jgi:ribonuclease BN (tRNA processing enzyme)
MKFTFLGTRALTEKGSSRHTLNSALLVQERKTRLLVDCGSDWLGRIKELAPKAIAITHAHTDHAGGLEEGAPVQFSQRKKPGKVCKAILSGKNISCCRKILFKSAT